MSPPLRRLFVAALGSFLLACTAARAQNVPDRNMVIVNPQGQSVEVWLGNSETGMVRHKFRRKSTNEVPYRPLVRIDSKDKRGRKVSYTDTLSPAGKYAIVKEDSGRLVLRVPVD